MVSRVNMCLPLPVEVIETNSEQQYMMNVIRVHVDSACFTSTVIDIVSQVKPMQCGQFVKWQY